MRRLIAVLAALGACAALAAPALADVAPGADRVTDLPDARARSASPVRRLRLGLARRRAPTCCARDRAGLFYWLAGTLGRLRDAAHDPVVQRRPRREQHVRASSRRTARTSSARRAAWSPTSTAGRAWPTTWPSTTRSASACRSRSRARSPRASQDGDRELASAVTHVVARDGLQKSPLFLTGESYGGTYMPWLAKRLLDTHAPGRSRRRRDHGRLGRARAAGRHDRAVRAHARADRRRRQAVAGPRLRPVPLAAEAPRASARCAR